jgi:hypothetical protein
MEVSEPGCTRDHWVLVIPEGKGQVPTLEGCMLFFFFFSFLPSFLLPSFLSFSPHLSLPLPLPSYF